MDHFRAVCRQPKVRFNEGYTTLVRIVQVYDRPIENVDSDDEAYFKSLECPKSERR